MWGTVMTRFLIALVLAIFSGIVAVDAQTFPSRSITIVVPFPPGGSTDTAARIMVAKNDLPANNLAELVTWMKANPGKINFVNQNAAANVTGVLFENLTQQKVQFIPYRGAGPAMTDLISGTVDLLVVQGAVALPQIRGRQINAPAHMSPPPSASM